MNRQDVPIINAFRLAATAMLLFALVLRAHAHHGGGTFDNTKTIELTGTLTRLELINPHSWIYFDATGPDGKVHAYRCEMRSATVLRRSGWKEEMFEPGLTITIEAQPDRKDPNSCYLNTIVLQYGQLGFTRTIHMDQKTHPASIKPSRAGHSIGRWENDVLIVDTVGFTPGVLSPPILNSDKLHVVERFSLDTAKMELTRSYTAEDPVYFKGQYSGSDVVQVADLPYNPDTCKEQAFVDYSKAAANRK
jgi:hypothetical protein